MRQSQRAPSALCPPYIIAEVSLYAPRMDGIHGGLGVQGAPTQRHPKPCQQLFALGRDEFRVGSARWKWGGTAQGKRFDFGED